MLIHIDLDNELYNIALQELRDKIDSSEELSTFEFLILPNSDKIKYIETDCSINPCILHLIDSDITKRYLKYLVEYSDPYDKGDFDKLHKSIRKLYIQILVDFDPTIQLEFYEFQYLEEDPKLDYITNTGLNNLSVDFSKWFTAYKRQLKMDSVLK
jgi:hypothetical protein